MDTGSRRRIKIGGNLMNKIKRSVVATATAFLVAPAILALSPLTANAYTVDNTYAFSTNEGDDTRTNNKFIVLHDVGTESGARANANYFKNNWATAQTYTQYTVGDGGQVFKIGDPGYRAWGAGNYANDNSPVQIELGHASTYEQFKQDYASYVELAHDSAVQFGIPLQFNNANGGIITHQFVSQNFWGDHQDPQAYLAKWGVSIGQLGRDVVNGYSSLGGSSSVSAAPSQSAPATPQPSQSTNSNQYWYDDDGTRVTKEDGYFTPGTYLRDWAYPGRQQTSYIGFSAGEAKIHYFGYVRANGYVYVAYHGNDGYVHYIAVRDGNTGEALGNLE